jgi:hypothetical protein
MRRNKTMIFGSLPLNLESDADYSIAATEAYILEELRVSSRTLQYFTDNTSIEDRANITKALGNLIRTFQVTRRGNIFRLKELYENR